MRESYPSDISRDQFEKIRSMLEGLRKKTKPRKLDLYDVFCGVLYINRTGCQWRMLPKDYPKWSSVYAYFRIWNNADESGESILDAALKKLG
jgi:transposase